MHLDTNYNLYNCTFFVYANCCMLDVLLNIFGGT